MPKRILATVPACEDSGMPTATGNVVPFRRFKADGVRRDQRALLDAVYAAGSLPIAASDRETKLIASRLQVFGFVAIDEVGGDGALRRLRASESMRAAGDRPWRVAKPSFGSLAALIPDADRFLFDPSPAA
jgi:hypothetical protein